MSAFLKALVSVDRRDAMIFSVYDKKTQKYKGTGSSITSVAPTPTGHAGNQYRKLVIDEAGEQLELMALWSNAEDTICQETERVGTPYIFGTMGDTAKAGKGLKEFWTRNDLYNLERFGIYGYNALIMDDLGNDMIEDSIRWILYTRKRREGGSEIVYRKWIQKYPLNDQDAFLTISGSGVGNAQLRAKQETKLLESPPLTVKGWMRPRAGGGSDFVPDPKGKIIVYERPQLLTNGYVAAVDPAEDDDVQKTRDTSNLGTAILAKPAGLLPPRLVLEYVDRPAKLADYYLQLALALEWYNNTQVLIELNKGGFRMKDWFELYYPKLLALAPKSSNSAKNGFEMRIGIKQTPDRKVQMMGLLDGHWEHYWESIPSLRFIEECAVFGNDHADDDFATAYGWCLVQLQNDRRVAQALDAGKAALPDFGYKRIGNQIVMVNRGQPVSNNFRKINNPLFNR